MARKTTKTKNASEEAKIPVEKLQEAVQEITEQQAQDQQPQQGQVQVLSLIHI